MNYYDKSVMQTHFIELQDTLQKACLYLEYIREHYDFNLPNANQEFPLMAHDVGLFPGQRNLWLTLEGIDDQLIEINKIFVRAMAHIEPSLVKIDNIRAPLKTHKKNR